MPDPVGYQFLKREFGLKTLALRVESQIVRGARRDVTIGGIERRNYSPAYYPGARPEDHLEFALKHEPLNLELLSAWLEHHRAAAETAVATLVRSKPMGEYARRAWFLAEWLTGCRLELPNGKPRPYVPALDPETHVGWSVGSRKTGRSTRHHVLNNLPGTAALCPLTRRTQAVNELLQTDFREALEKTVAPYGPELLKRATNFLYLKETKASFELEGEHPSDARLERFVAQLQEVSRAPWLRAETLLGWQNALVESRFKATGYRTDQNYVGEASRFGRRERAHYVCPKPEDVPSLMDGLFSIDALDAGLPPLVHAAALSFAFVFIHPYDDGNGRIHRLLLHYLLHRRGVTPDGIVFPVSAAMLDNRRDYDDVLESFSQPLLREVEYALDEEGRMSVEGSTVNHYRYFDLTPMVEALGRWIHVTLDRDFPDELGWLQAWDKTRSQMQRIVDMPEKLLRLFVTFTLGNSGHLSAAKRQRFAMLTDEEVARLETLVRDNLLPFRREE
jgi:hypothetical protein